VALAGDGAPGEGRADGMKDTAHKHRHRVHRVAHLGRAALLRRAKRLRNLSWRFLHRKWIWRIAIGSGVTFAVALLAVAGLWWRLSNGPIELDMATPWLKKAMEENFGGNHSVSVGGTQIERDENGRPTLRLRDIVVRDVDGTVVASAPKAEVGLSGGSLFSGRLVAESLNLVGAELSIRIEKDGRVTVFTGADKRPIATAQAPVAPPAGGGKSSGASAGGSFDDVAEALAWLDKIGQTGLDGHDLRELGLKDGGLVVEDQRDGKRWIFDRINASLMRPAQGGIMFKLESDAKSRPWFINAAMRPLEGGLRAVGIEARKVSMRDIMLALRLNEGGIEADLPVSASVRAEIAADGTPRRVNGEVLAEAGDIVDRLDPNFGMHIDRADVRFSWDVTRGMLVVPFQVQASGNQFTMRAIAEAPTGNSTAWTVSMQRDDPVIDPIILGPPAGSDEETLALNRANLKLRIDFVKRRIELDQADVRRIDTRATHNFGVAFSGSLDMSSDNQRLAFGVAGNRMPTWALKRLWPAFIAPNVRRWAADHVSGGTVERVVVAGNAPLSEFNPSGPPMAEDGLSVDIETSGTAIKPLEKLPAIRDADLAIHVTGRNATVNLGRGTVDVAPGRRLNIAGGILQVPDTHPKPSPTHVSFRMDGTLPAAAALLQSDGLRDKVGLPLDPATTRGAVSAQVNIDFPLGKDVPADAFTYGITADITNFGADKGLLGQKVEAASLKASASRDGYQITGDARINGTPANIELVRRKGDTDSELHVAAKLDETARHRLGLDVGSAVVGSIPVKLTARIGGDDSEQRMAVEADLTPVKLDNLLPGWDKAAGKPARATFTFVKTAKGTRFDDLAISGDGANVQGAVELDSSGNIASANFPTFAFSDGDKLSLKADRNNDGVLKVIMRGDVYDGRSFLQSSLANTADPGRKKQSDIDVDVKIGTVAGHNGETLRGLDLSVSRRGGHIRTFNLNAKIGRDTPLIGDMRVRARDSHPVIYLETADAGALLRLIDMYPRMYGGQIWVAVDPPTQDAAPQVGTVFVRNFVVRNEPTLARVVSNAPGANANAVEFSEARVDFTRFTGRMAVRDGVVRGPVVGATIEGQIDYAKNDVHLRGTFVPFYGLNNMFGQIPIVGLFLGGGSNEGLLGITYEAVGPPSSPRITVNPVTAITPGLLRKFIPSPGSFDRNFVPPTR
jgi:hypothetical protein